MRASPPGPPCSTPPEPTLSLVRDTLLGLVTWLGDHRALYSEFANSLFALAGVEATIGRRNLWGPPEDLDVALNGRHEERRIILLRNDPDVGDDAAICFLHLDHLSEFGRTVKFAAPKDLGVRLEDADQLCLRVRHAAHDSGPRLLNDAARARRHLAQDLEGTLDLSTCRLLHLRDLCTGLPNGRLRLTNEPPRDSEQSPIRLLDGLLRGLAAKTKSLSDLAHAA
jgi:hypothetical protein